MRFSILCNFALLAAFPNSITSATSISISDGRWVSNEDVMKIKLARRHVMRRLGKCRDPKALVIPTAYLLEALDLPMFTEDISPTDPLIQKLKREKEDRDNKPLACQMAVCNECGGSSITTCRCAKERQRKHRDEYYSIDKFIA
jgi:hypothetical protein